jgi:hypothetical protein
MAAASFSVGQSDWLPMMMPTTAPMPPPLAKERALYLRHHLTQ